MKLFEIRNETPKFLLTESKNVHLEHLEDLIFNQGYAGAQEAVNYIESLRHMLAEGTGTTTRLTVKWDGSPAVICGVDPADGRFFVGTKAVFSKGQPRLIKSPKDAEKYYSDKPELAVMLAQTYTYLSKLGIGGVVQGDLLFTEGMVTVENIREEDCYVFTPNTITYAVPVNTQLGQRIQRAKLGIIFHTQYQGASIQEMIANPLHSVQGFNQHPDVWFDDANYKDYTGIASLTPSENTKITNMLSATLGTMEKVGQQRFDTVMANKEFVRHVKPFVNRQVRGGAQITNPTQFIKDFITYYTAEQTKDIEDPTSRMAQNRLAKIQAKEQWVADNANSLLGILAVYKRLIEMKSVLLAKLQQVEGIGTFQKTNDGYKVTTPEGFVAIGHDGGAVKLVDRLEFSRQNFAKRA